MGPPSAPRHRGCIPCQGFLLTVSLLTSWNPAATAQFTVESMPFNVTEGKDVLLLIHNLPQNRLAYNWYKGQMVDRNQLIATYSIASQTQTPGPAHSGRETIYPNASLLFQRVTMNDTGFYRIQIITADFQNAEGTGQFHVHPELPKPSITSNNSSPVENKNSVALTCEPETQDTVYLWWINGQSFPVSPRLELSKNNRTLTLLNVTRNDAGPYECGNQNPVSRNRSDPVTLNVLYGPDAPTISPPDSTYRPGANLNLSCHADSNPPAQYSWFINGSFLQSTQVLFIPNINVNNGGSYTCLANNSATGNNRTTVKIIAVSEPEPMAQSYIQATSTIVTEDKVPVIVTCLTNDTGISIQWVFKNQTLLLSERMKLSLDNSTLSTDAVKREDAGEYQCEVSNAVSYNQSVPLRLTVKYLSQGSSPGLSAGAIVGIVIGVLGGVALIAALVYFLHFRKTGRASDQRDLTEHKPSASNHIQGHSDNSPNKPDEVAYSSLDFKAQQQTQPTSATPSSKVTETIYSEVKKN
ncbi:carcinoembryonic antigen-related cell adhesion molecule 1-like isoform X2 [Carlito syrichta]|uniref:Carcinoembryonic antigen-related cell adhesion molecule 1-like isoform X2 n=1 Tax=Carlito syrichta TaxID=1868482 RepID=A0A1U7TW33_CARSF|nr:carcinoembryonic antigen-related cell adhesion molecule 1-like isoform X2 [Carlito syrichta]